MQLIWNWFRRTFNDPQVVILAVILLFGFVGIALLGKIMAPILAAIVIAYLLEGLVSKLQRMRVPRFPAVLIVYMVFLAFFVVVLLVVTPYVAQQSVKLLQRMPAMIEKSQDAMIAYLDERNKGDEAKELEGDSSLETTFDINGKPHVAIPESESTMRVVPLATNDLVTTNEITNSNAPSGFTFRFPFGAGNDPTETTSEENIKWVTNLINERLAEVGTFVAKRITEWGKGIITLVVYLVLVPILIFFFLKDKDRLKGYIAKFLPEDRKLATSVWREVDVQLGNYVRGKALEIIIVWGITFSTFRIIGLQYAMLLAVFTGLSVLIPYVGATVMTIPVALIAYFQYGVVGSEFYWAVGAYLIIQLFDGNLLAPLLLSEVTNLHPTAVIGAVLLFGGLFGFWGVFFAIPLATLVHAVINAWPRAGRAMGMEEESVHEPEAEPAG